MFLSDEELINIPAGSDFIFDVECYINFFFVGFKYVDTGKFINFEQSPDHTLNIDKLRWLLFRHRIIGFNSNSYDIPLVTLALTGLSTEELFNVSFDIIRSQIKAYAILKKFKVQQLPINHVDLIEVCPLAASLKTYAGRLHCKKMQDLPVDPLKQITFEEAEEIRVYNRNDLDNTQLIFDELKNQLDLRDNMSVDFNQDLRSKSDAQIAESVITSEVAKINGYYSKKPIIKEGSTFKYKIPDNLRYRSSVMLTVLDHIRDMTFTIDGNGSPKAPKSFEGKIVTIGNSKYRMGLGGLHSTEKSIAHIADKNTLLIDRDVESYYPRIVINQELYPTHLGKSFLTVYEGIVNRRIEAKRAKNSIVADSLKITINGSFGKLGSKYSALYAPDLLLQVTISGQLYLLMLIERIEMAGIPVVSGNTDGIVIKCPVNRYEELNHIIQLWEEATNFITEETRYKATYSKDINNYIAVKEDGKCKSKGVYNNPWSDPKTAIFRFHKNPQTTICIESIEQFITKKVPIEKTVHSCTDIRKFISVRNVKGGAVKNGNYLGKAIRWYYAKDEKGYIEYKTNGHKVPKTDGAKPLMDLPDEFPTDINYNWYIEEAEGMLFDMGYYKKKTLF